LNPCPSYRTWGSEARFLSNSTCSRRCREQVLTHGIHGFFLTCENYTSYYTDTRRRQWLLVVKRCMYIHQTMYILNINLPASTLVAGLRTSLYNNAHVLNNVHTWALVFLRHLASMPFMVPFWAYTDSGSVPISRSPCYNACPEEIVYSLNDSCSHFTQRLFPPNVPHQHIVNILL
jgi:hypothetical protein